VVVERSELGRLGFGSRAAAYERSRPDYPTAAVEWLVDALDLRRGSTVLDLGAGTGKFARAIVERGLNVVAVEPSDDMRRVLGEVLPTVQVLPGTADAIPLPDESVDAVAVAQAFHWFDADVALHEMARVLRDEGGIGLVWNERDESVPWVFELSRRMRWHECRPYEVGMDFRPVVDAVGLFSPCRQHLFSFADELDHRGLLERVATSSYIVAMGDAERTELLADVGQWIATLPNPVQLPYVTAAYVARRNGSAR
jgi:SAM-dependent methyltransferase